MGAVLPNNQKISKPHPASVIKSVFLELSWLLDSSVASCLLPTFQDKVFLQKKYLSCCSYSFFVRYLVSIVSAICLKIILGLDLTHIKSKSVNNIVILSKQKEKSYRYDYFSI